jgi:diguanylate cyclase (GGDEF)-like protein
MRNDDGGGPVAACVRWRSAALPWVLAVAIVLIAVELQRHLGEAETPIHALSLALLAAAWIGTLWQWGWVARNAAALFDAALMIEVAGGLLLVRVLGNAAGAALISDLLLWAPAICAWWASCYLGQARRIAILAAIFFAACFAAGQFDTDQAVNELLQSAMLIALVTVFARCTMPSKAASDPRDFDNAMHDSLTNVASRVYFEAELAHTAAMAERYQQPFSLLVATIDGYADYCRKFGNDEGVRLVRAFAWVIAERIRRSDTVCRWQDETFVVLLPFTRHAEAVKLVETLRPAVVATEIGAKAELKTRFGVAEHVPGEDALVTFDLAERAMDGMHPVEDDALAAEIATAGRNLAN